MGHQDTLDEFVAEKAEDGLSSRERKEIGKLSRKLRDTSVNLAYARMAVRFVEQKLALVANWDASVPSSAESVYQVGIDTARSEADRIRAEANSKAAWNKADQCVYGDLRQTKEWQRIDAQTGGVQDLQDIQILSDLADHYGCGNCGELTAVTFIYLYNLSIRPLDFMVLKPPADHAFVVIGRSGKSDDDSFGRNWGGDAVICDPWASGLKAFFPGSPYGPIRFGDTYAAYSAAFLEQNMKAMHRDFNGASLAYREQ
jgi:hypothetical protein